MLILYVLSKQVCLVTYRCCALLCGKACVLVGRYGKSELDRRLTMCPCSCVVYVGSYGKAELDHRLTMCPCSLRTSAAMVNRSWTVAVRNPRRRSWKTPRQKSTTMTTCLTSSGSPSLERIPAGYVRTFMRQLALYLISAFAWADTYTSRSSESQGVSL